MPNVTLQVLTRWRGASRTPGAQLNVPEAVADRWVKRGIARLEVEASAPKPKRSRAAAPVEKPKRRRADAELRDVPDEA